MNQQSESNKPSWDDAPSWANWLACDGTGEYSGQWWWFADKPSILAGPGVWWATGVGAPKFSGNSADLEWAKENWDMSIEHRPTPDDDKIAKPKNEYLSSPDKKRVTLFIDFDGPVSDDHQLARNTATMLRSWFNGEDCAVHLFTPGSHSVSRVRIAVGNEKMEEVEYDFDGYHIKEHKYE